MFIYIYVRAYVLPLYIHICTCIRVTCIFTYMYMRTCNLYIYIYVHVYVLPLCICIRVTCMYIYSHMDFLTSAAKMFAQTMSVPQSEINLDPGFISKVLSTVNVPEFKPKSKVTIAYIVRFCWLLHLCVYCTVY